MPQCATAIHAQIECDDASDDFVKEKLHSKVRSRPVDWSALRLARFKLRLRSPLGQASKPLAQRLWARSPRSEGGGGRLRRHDLPPGPPMPSRGLDNGLSRVY